MKVNKGSSKNGTTLDSVIEVRICSEMWERIKWVAQERESSYSWVVRYAVFRLIKRRDPKKIVHSIGNPRFIGSNYGGLNKRAWGRRLGASHTGGGAKHRHQLCLYGADELAIRYTTAYYGCTMTHLVRFALELYFERLYSSVLRSSKLKSVGAMSNLQRAFWFWLGIKHYRDAEFRSITLEERFILFRRYKRGRYRLRNS